MKKMILSLVACVALVFSGMVAWCCYRDILCVVCLICAMAASCLFEQGRQEHMKSV